MKTLAFLTILFICFPFNGKAQSLYLNGGEGSLKNLNKIVIEGIVGNGIQSPRLYRNPGPEGLKMEKFQIWSHLNQKFQEKIKPLLKDLDIKTVEYLSQNPKPPRLYLKISEDATSSKHTLAGDFKIFITEQAVLKRSNKKVFVISWIKRESYLIDYQTMSELKYKLTNVLDKIIKDFELDYYRANNK